MVNFGSNIKFKEFRNDWIASANIEHNDTIFIHDNKKTWMKEPLNYAIKSITSVIPHETIHNILFCEGLDYDRTYDRIRNKIVLNRKISPKMREFYYSCM